MQGLCFIRGHKWNGCKCTSCGKVRNQDHSWSSFDCSRCILCNLERAIEHEWDGCMCRNCRTERDESHDWDKDCEECSRCKRKRAGAHSWNGCQCTICGTNRTEGHNWNGCQCTICGRITSERRKHHKWTGATCAECKCSECGSRLRAVFGRTDLYDDYPNVRHDWSKGYRFCAKCGVSGYSVCAWAVDMDLKRPELGYYLGIVAEFLDMGMDPFQSYYTDGYERGRLDRPGSYGESPGGGPEDDRPLIRAVQRGNVRAVQLMGSKGASLSSTFRGQTLLSIAESYVSRKVASYLRNPTTFELSGPNQYYLGPDLQYVYRRVHSTPADHQHHLRAISEVIGALVTAFPTLPSLKGSRAIPMDGDLMISIPVPNGLDKARGDELRRLLTTALSDHGLL